MFVSTGSSHYIVDKIQSQSSLFFFRYITVHVYRCLSGYSVNRDYSFGYLIVCRCQSTVSNELVLSEKSQYIVFRVQCESSLFFPVRHSIMMSGYSVNRVCAFRYVTVYHFQGTVSIEFILSGTSKYNVVRIQRQSSLCFPLRHSISFSGYSVDRVYSFRYVKV